MGVPRNFRYDSASNKLAQFALPKAHGNIMSIAKVEYLKDDEAVLINSKMGFTYVLFSAHVVLGIDEVKKLIEKWSARKIEKFIAPKKPASFGDTLGARFYKESNKKQSDKWMPFAVPAGHEYAFLALLKLEK